MCGESKNVSKLFGKMEILWKFNIILEIWKFYENQELLLKSWNVIKYHENLKTFFKNQEIILKYKTFLKSVPINKGIEWRIRYSLLK